MVEEIEQLERVIRAEIDRQAKASNDELLFDPKSGMVEGVIDIHTLARRLVELTDRTVPSPTGQA